MNISFRCKLFDQVFIDAEHVIPYPEMITSVADAILQGSSFAADIVHLDDPVYSPERIQFNSLIQKILAIFLRFDHRRTLYKKSNHMTYLQSERRSEHILYSRKIVSFLLRRYRDHQMYTRFSYFH